MATDLQEMAKQEAHALEGIVWVDPERMDGAPCFYGTRVPIKILFDYIEGGANKHQSLRVGLERVHALFAWPKPQR